MAWRICSSSSSGGGADGRGRLPPPLLSKKGLAGAGSRAEAIAVSSAPPCCDGSGSRSSGLLWSARSSHSSTCTGSLRFTSDQLSPSASRW